MCVNWSTLVVTNFVYMCRSVDAVQCSHLAIQKSWKICHQAELDSIELLQHCVYPEWTGCQLWTLQGL